MAKHRIPIEDRFWLMVRKTRGCWLWTGATQGSMGYGVLATGGKQGGQTRAHRLSWEIHNGPIPSGLWVLHTCDNPRCVRPDHLWLGTRQDNVDDCVTKGRNAGGGGKSLGEAHGMAKLTNDVVLAMRADYPAMTQKAIAEKYGTNQTTVSLVVNRKRWTHI
jgi:hypothetical protein